MESALEMMAFATALMAFAALVLVFFKGDWL